MAKIKIKNVFLRFYKIVKAIIISLFVLFLCFFIVLNTPYAKDKIAQEAIKFLNKEFTTSFAVDKVEIDYLGNVVLYNLSVKDMHDYKFISINKATVYLDFIKLIKNLKDIKIKYIKIEKPIVHVITYKGEDIDNFSWFTKKFASEKEEPSNFKLKMKIDLSEGIFSIENRNLPNEDINWLNTKDLNISVKSFQINGSLITASLDKFNFIGERHNEEYILKDIKGNITYSDSLLSFKDFLIQTADSDIKGQLTFKYKKSDDLADFANKVKWDLKIDDKSTISGKEIRYFVKNWDNNGKMSLSGFVNGTLSNLLLKDVKISGNNTFLIAKNASFKGLSGDKNLDITLNESKLQTTYESLPSFLPTFITKSIPQELKDLGTANYNGNFRITSSDIAAKGTLISSIGEAKADLVLSNYKKIPLYKGEIIANNINLGKFVKSLGPISGKITVDGKGFSLNTINAHFTSQLEQFSINGKIIKELEVEGVFKDKIFTGLINSKDPHAEINFDGSLDFNKEKMHSVFKAEVSNLDLNYFELAKEATPILSGEISGDIEFTDLKDLTGDLKITQIQLKTKEREDSFSDIEISTKYDEQGNRNLDIFSPNMIIANIYGKYNLDDIPEMLKNGLGGLTISYKSKHMYEDQRFTFVLDLQKSLFDLFMIDVDMSSGTTITGNYDSNSNKLEMQAISQNIKYKNINIKSPNLFINSANLDKQFGGSLEELEIQNTDPQKNIYFSDISLEGKKRNDSLLANTSFNFGKTDNILSRYDFNLYQIRENNVIVFGLLKSFIDINNNQWVFNANSIRDESLFVYDVKGKQLTFSNLIAKSDSAVISSSGYYNSSKDFSVNLSFDKVDLNKLIPKDYIQNLSVDGLLNGDVKLLQNSDMLNPLANLTIKDLELNKKNHGDLFLDISRDEKTKGFVVTGILDKEGENRLLVNGGINLVDKTPVIDIKLNANKLDLSPIGLLLSGIFSNFRGEASGDVDIKGSLKNLDYEGSLTMKDFGFTVDYLGVDYQIANPKSIKLSNKQFLLDDIEIYDTKEHTKARVNGILSTQNFTSWALDIQILSSKALVLNTSSKQNDLFYGRAIAQGIFTISGPTNNLLISATAKVLDGSVVTFNSSSAQSVSDTPYLIFESKRDSINNASSVRSGLTIKATIDATPESQVNVIIDEQAGNRIEARGTADKLQFEMNKFGKITMAGTYTIANDSKFYFKTLLDKDFTIEPGSSIQWNGGSPMDADLNITASYQRTVTNLADYLGVEAPAMEAKVQVILTDKLSKPKIGFNIKASGLNTAISEDLALKLNNEDERKNQAVAILLTGGFLVNDKLGISSSLSSVYEIFIKQALQFVNNINSHVNIDVEITPGSSSVTSADLLGMSDRMKTSIEVLLTKRFTLFGAVSMPLATKNAADIWNFEGNMEYDISKDKDKSLLINVFTKPTTFGIENVVIDKVNQSIGAGVTFRKSFDHFSELFKKNEVKNEAKKEKKNQSENTKKISENIKKNTIKDILNDSVITQ